MKVGVSEDCEDKVGEGEWVNYRIMKAKEES